jgi:hypothetical protein
MSNQEILAKAVEKAIAGGWQPLHLGKEPIDKELITVEHIMFSSDPRMYIYSHDFAKALWGDATVPESEEIDDNQVKLGLYEASGGSYEGYLDFCDIEFSGEPWQYHLQQMVITDDPIKYLSENLTNSRNHA